MDPVGPAWRKSTRCDSNACLEAAQWAEGVVAVRDNTRPDQHLQFDRASWNNLLRALRTGQLHR